MNGRLGAGWEVKKKEKKKDVCAVSILNSLFESWTAIGLSVFSVSSVSDLICLDGALHCSFLYFLSVFCFLFPVSWGVKIAATRIREQLAWKWLLLHSSE